MQSLATMRASSHALLVDTVSSAQQALEVLERGNHFVSIVHHNS
jgi:hypothetical protein